MKALLGIKKGMTRIFRDEKVIPVTVVEVKDCVLSNKEEKGFELGLGKSKNPNKAITGKYKEVKKVPQYRQYLKGDTELNIGDEIKADIFEGGEKVTVMGVSKGKGFQGVVKRWGFKGGQRTHGQSDRQRAPGSIGAGTDPGRVLRGKKMGGRMGSDTVTIKNKEIVDVKGEYLLISGPLPGSNEDLIAIYTEN
jgi:large subunit ribosomal protein L3